MLRLSLLACASVLACALTSVPADAQAPAGYYASVDLSSPAALRQTLHAIIDDHVRFPYTSSRTDTWDVLERADQDPTAPGNILDVNKNASYPKQGGGNNFYNRDHIWPKSYGYPIDNSSNYPYTDCHTLFLSDSAYNSARSNKPYRDCASFCSERTTLFNAGRGGGSGVYPGNSNWTSGSGTSGIWEQWMGTRGDVARALFYMDVRYEGGLHGVTGAGEPDLILTDSLSLMAGSATGRNESVAYYGLLSVLLQWHAQDPVDANERRRNDVVFNYQRNRNPFVDHPEWVDCLFGTPVLASEAVRIGFPINPTALMAGVTAPPRLGATWDPVIDHTTFAVGAAADVLLLSAGATNVSTPFGTLLCNLGSPTLVVAGTPGVPFAVPVPSDCRLAGAGLSAQGLSADAGGMLQLTNALDVTFGY